MINKESSSRSRERDAVNEERMSNDRAYCAFVITRTIRYRSTWLGIVTYDLELPPRMIHSLSPFIRPVRSCRACSWPRLRRKIPAGIGITRWISREFILHARTHALWECTREDRISLTLEFIHFKKNIHSLFIEFVRFLKVSLDFSIGLIRLYLIAWHKWLLTTIMEILRRFITRILWDLLIFINIYSIVSV